MENRSDILIELQSISPTLAEIAPVNPYTVPEGYFENLASEVLLQLKDEITSPVLDNMVGTTPYEIPSNYFDKFPEQLLARIKREAASPALAGKAINPYQAPEGYFDALAETILKRVKGDGLSAKEELESLSPLLSTVDKKTPFTIPVGYFEELTGSVVGGVKAIDNVNEELNDLSPLMDRLRMVNVYQVPHGYFENLPSVILDKTKQHQPAKVVSMTFRKKALRYAAAAVVAGMIITAGFLFSNRQSSTVPSGSLVQAEEIIDREIQTSVEGLSDDELVNFLENQTAPLPDILSASATAEIDSDDVKMMLADIPDSELNQYLVEYSDGKEVLTN